MSGYNHYGNEEEIAELKKLLDEVQADDEDFEKWEKLVRAADGLEGGLNRNSSPQSITAARDVYDRFLARYPLFFGYWKKYADLEFAIAGTEAAEYIYERGLASVNTSVDLWLHYCSFKIETCHDTSLIRELFERGVDSVGLDFLAHPLWDKFLEYETRSEGDATVFAILGRLIHVPLHQYARYFERFRALAARQPVTTLAPEQVINSFVAESTRTAQMQGGTAADIENDVRLRVDAYYMEIFHRTQNETTRRWTYEQEIKRPYFHVTELDESQLSNWTKYLDFEEAEGNFQRTMFLYERCLVACANYDEYWQRYARWMDSQPDRAEETRIIYQRASYFFTPIARPAIRKNWALFEEVQGRSDVADEIYRAILLKTPNDDDTVQRLANLELRQKDLLAAGAVYQYYIEDDSTPVDMRGTLVGHLALLTYTSQGGSAAKARAIFEKATAGMPESEPFWRAWLEFEMRLPAQSGDETEMDKLRARVKGVFKAIRNDARLPQERIAGLTRLYMQFLTQRGGKDAAREYMDLDALVDGSAVVVHAARQRGVGVFGVTNLPLASAKKGLKGQAGNGHHKAADVNGH